MHHSSKVTSRNRTTMVVSYNPHPVPQHRSQNSQLLTATRHLRFVSRPVRTKLLSGPVTLRHNGSRVGHPTLDTPTFCRWQDVAHPETRHMIWGSRSSLKAPVWRCFPLALPTYYRSLPNTRSAGILEFHWINPTIVIPVLSTRPPLSSSPRQVKITAVSFVYSGLWRQLPYLFSYTQHSCQLHTLITSPTPSNRV